MFASPLTNHVTTHQRSYASPYSDSLNQPPVNYASPYANTGPSSQANGLGSGASSGVQANKHDGVTQHDPKEDHTPRHDIIRVPIEANSRSDESARRDISNKAGDASKASKEANDQAISDEKKETGKACDEANDQGSSRENDEMSNVVDLDETDVGDADKPDINSQENEARSDDEMTNDHSTTARNNNQNIAPPAEDHKLFTGERLGDFTSRENIDWLLTVGNGGKILRPSKVRHLATSSGAVRGFIVHLGQVLEVELPLLPVLPLGFLNPFCATNKASSHSP